MFQQESSHCFYEFTWETPAACPIQAQVGSNCAVTNPDTGVSINLSSIPTLVYPFTTGGKNGNFTVSVCKPIKCGTATVSGVCQNYNGVTTSMGNVNQSPLYTDGTISLSYTNGGPCPTGGNYSSDIEFYCDPLAISKIVLLVFLPLYSQQPRRSTCLHQTHAITASPSQPTLCAK